MSGHVVHVEIPADDTAAGARFWGSLFGWEFTEYPGPFEYRMTRISEQTGTAITNMEPGKHGMRPYFAVEDVNTAAARVRALGGEANEPRPIPQTGWLSTCKDPHGNEFGLWQHDPTAPAQSGA